MAIGLDGVGAGVCPISDWSSCSSTTLQAATLFIHFFQCFLAVAMFSYNLIRPLKIATANYFVMLNTFLQLSVAFSYIIAGEGSVAFIVDCAFTHLVSFHILVLSVVCCQIEILKAMLGLKADSSWLRKEHLTRLQIFFVVMYFICNIGLFMKSQSLGYTTSIDSWYYDLLSFFDFIVIIYEEAHNIYVYRILTARWKELVDLKNAKEAGGKTDKGTKTEGGGWNISLNMNALKSVSSSGEAQDSGNGEQGVVIKAKDVGEDYESTKRTLVEISGISTLRYLIIATFVSDTVSFLIIIYGLFFLAHGEDYVALGIALVSTHVFYVSLILYCMKNLGIKSTLGKAVGTSKGNEKMANRGWKIGITSK